MAKTDLSGYGEYTTTYSCGHTSQDMVFPARFAQDRTSSCKCSACQSADEKKVNNICRKLTGSAPDGTKLTWRLRATEEVVRAALATAGVGEWVVMQRDAGDNAATEQRIHAGTLKLMQAGRVRCACGDTGSWNDTISGSIGMKHAIWAACPNCSGSAVGGGIAGDEAFAVSAAIDSANRCGEDINDWVDAA